LQRRAADAVVADLEPQRAFSTAIMICTLLARACRAALVSASATMKYSGARSVKSLERIEGRSTPRDGYFQHIAYGAGRDRRSTAARPGRRRSFSADLRRPARRPRGRGRPRRGAPSCASTFFQ
jgi:hypothetical protein